MTRIRPILLRSRATLAALAACGALLALPAAGHAKVQVIGSDLSKPANLTRSYGADSAFWQTAIDGDPTRGVVPVDGQVTIVNLKGTGPPGGSASPNNQFHFQVLHPVGGGAVRVDLSSEAYYMPAAGSPNDIKSFKPVNLCVHKGDYVDFNDVGGGGVPWTVFNRDPDSMTEWYSKDNGTKNGAVFSPLEHQQEELLLQAAVASGPDATDICPGGYMQHVFQGADVKDGQQAVLRTRVRYTKVRTFCPGPTYGYCIGDLTLEAVLGGRNTVIGSQSFKITPTTTPSVQVSIAKSTVKQLQKAGTVSVKAVVKAHDAPKSDRRANPGVPAQSKTTSSRFTLRPDKPLKQTKHKKKRRH